MSKRASIGDRISKDSNKYTKAINAFTSDESHNDVSGNTAKDANKNVNINVINDTSKIIVKKVKVKNEPKRATYYLMPDTLKRIDSLSTKTGMGKSALVQILLNEALDRVEIE